METVAVINFRFQNRKLPPVPGTSYNTCDRIKRGTVISKFLISVLSLSLSHFHIRRSLLKFLLHEMFVRLIELASVSIDSPFHYDLFMQNFNLIEKEGRNGSNSCTWDFRRPIYEELKQGSPPPLPPSRHYRPDYYHKHTGQPNGFEFIVLLHVRTLSLICY